MATKPRIMTPHLVRHVVSRGNGRMKIFLDDVDFRVFLHMLGEVVEEYDLECWNYCLMPNHYHLTLKPTRANLPRAMQRLNGEYGKAWNRRHRHVGHVFQGRYKDQIVQSGRYQLAVGRYVALNPVRAQLTDTPEAWPWSSYGAICGLTDPPAFLSIASTLEMFGKADPASLRAQFAEFVLRPAIDEGLHDRLRSTERVIGDRDFKKSICPSVRKKSDESL